jgi:hypothetical protein
MLIPLHPLGCDDAHVLVTDGTGSIDFHLCGTRRVYAQPERSSVCETVALRPRSPYGRSKLFVERPLLELDPPRRHDVCHAIGAQRAGDAAAYRGDVGRMRTGVG